MTAVVKGPLVGQAVVVGLCRVDDAVGFCTAVEGATRDQPTHVAQIGAADEVVERAVGGRVEGPEQAGDWLVPSLFKAAPRMAAWAVACRVTNRPASPMLRRRVWSGLMGVGVRLAKRWRESADFG